jgi:hypothetical protein
MGDPSQGSVSSPERVLLGSGLVFGDESAEPAAIVVEPRQ